MNPDLLSYFAAHAPVEIPEWFQPNEAVHNPGKLNRYFAWRWHYAQQMLRFQGLTHPGPADQPSHLSPLTSHFGLNTSAPMQKLDILEFLYGGLIAGAMVAGALFIALACS